MSKEPPCVKLSADVPVDILVDKHDPKLCWSDLGPHGS